MWFLGALEWVSLSRSPVYWATVSDIRSVFRSSVMNSICTQCAVPLEPEDGHDLCPPCLGLAHCEQAMTEQACINCSCMSLAVRRERLDSLHVDGGAVPPSKDSRRRAASGQGASGPPKKPRVEHDPVAQKVEALAAEFQQIKALLLNLQPRAAEAPPRGGGDLGRVPAAEAPRRDDDGHNGRAEDYREEDSISITASDSLFTEAERGGPGLGDARSPQRSEVGSVEPEEEAYKQAADVAFAKQAIQWALARQGIDIPVDPAAPPNPFFKTEQPAAFSVPASAGFIEELQKCWGDPKKLLHFSQECRALLTMAGSEALGLDRMPPVDETVASLVLSPDEAMNPDARCPRAQCKITDDYLKKSYDSAARMARLGNSLSHLAIALSQSLQEAGVDEQTQGISDVSLRTFAYMSRELGRLMSTLTMARRQVWLAQAPLSDKIRGSLLKLPVVPGVMFGPAAQAALERSVQAQKSKKQYADLRGSRSGRYHGSSSSGPSYPATSTRSSAAGRRSPPRRDQRPRDPPQQSFDFRQPTGRAPGRGAFAGRASHGPSKARGKRP